jgi:beta-galactosidase
LENLLTTHTVDMIQRNCFLIFQIIFLISSNAYAQKQQLTDWEFYKGDVGSLYEIWRSNEVSAIPAWEKVTVPHCYNAYDAVDPDEPYYQGPAWYRTYIDIEKIPEKHRVLLHFEGAGQKTEIYLSYFCIGKHTGGYNEFTFDITGALAESTDKFPGRIPLAVKTDNSRDVNLIPSNLSDFNLYGGIYRKVWIEIVPENYIRSVFIHPSLNAEKNLAEVKVDLSLGLSENSSNALVSLEIVTSDESPVFRQNKSIQLQQEKIKNCFEISLRNPDLWSIAEPELYTCIISLQTESGKHELRSKFGIRNFEFVENGPFILNGTRLFLRGMHRHEDHAGYGAAMPDELIRKEMIMIKDMGANFIRLGHYQQSELVLELCDSLGLLVWEEIPWCRGGVGYRDYQELAHNMLRDMIVQHFNHPSVILWGLGNEQDWPGDFEWYSEDSVRNLLVSLNALAHQLDAERKTCIRRCDFASDIVDVYSPSIWAGWYRGKYTDIMQVSKEWNEKLPRFFHAEWGASHHAYRHSDYPDKGLENIQPGETDERSGDFLPENGEPRVSRDGDWSVTYACNLIDWHLKEFENMPWHTGAAYWAFKDFSTPLRPDNPIPYVNQKGVVQRDLTPKESYYVFKSYWAPKPMVKIYGHTWSRRHGDAETEQLIKVYSNVSRVGVMLNGESLGIRKRNIQDFPAAGLRWSARYRHGENTVIAVSKQKGVIVSDTLTFYYQTEKWGKADRLESYRQEITGDTATVYFWAVDGNGIPCLDNKDIVNFSIAGSGKLLDDLGVMGGSRKIQLANGQAFIKVILNNGDNIIAASSEKLKSGFTLIETEGQ